MTMKGRTGGGKQFQEKNLCDYLMINEAIKPGGLNVTGESVLLVYKCWLLKEHCKLVPQATAQSQCWLNRFHKKKCL